MICYVDGVKGSIDLTQPEIAKLPLRSAPAIVFFDVDGTLVNSQHKISPDDIKQVSNLSLRGIKTSLATGRPLFACTELAANLKIDSLSIFFSGALVCTPDLSTILSEISISPSLLLDFVTALLGSDFYVELYTRDNYYCFEHNALTDLHATYLNRRAQLIDASQIGALGPILKIVVICPDSASLARYHSVSAPFSGIVTAMGKGAAHPDLHFANISASTASRPACFDAVCGHYQIESDAVMAFGDGEADIPFLELAGAGIAMGNSSDLVKARADFITKTVDQSGVAFALQRLLW